jgi:hypothetical protein
VHGFWFQQFVFMDEIIELTLESPDGMVDCRLEPQRTGSELSYSATILYPNTVNGFSRSEIYCLNLRRGKTGSYFFEDGADEVLPKIKKLEATVSNAITRKQAKD